MLEYILRKTVEEDMSDIFSLANEKAVIEGAIHQETITWDKHCLWFKKRIDDINCCFYTITTIKHVFIGYLRLDLEGDEWNITIAIDPIFRGFAIGKRVLLDIVSLWKNKKIIAYVRKNNFSSQKCFHNAGFIIKKQLEINAVALYKYGV